MRSVQVLLQRPFDSRRKLSPPVQESCCLPFICGLAEQLFLGSVSGVRGFSLSWQPHIPRPSTPANPFCVALTHCGGLVPHCHAASAPNSPFAILGYDHQCIPDAGAKSSHARKRSCAGTEIRGRAHRASRACEGRSGIRAHGGAVEPTSPVQYPYS